MARLFDRGGKKSRTVTSAEALAARSGHAELGFEAMQTLESRVHLDAGIVEAPLRWYGHDVKVDEGSWVLAFDDRPGRTAGMERARAVARAMGIEPTYVDATVSGRYAKFETPARITEGMAQAIVRNFPGLTAFDPDYMNYTALIPNDARFAEQYVHLNTGQFIPGLGDGLAGADMKSTEAWNTNTGSRQVVIAITDTGIDLDHPDLAPNLWFNPGEIPGNAIDDDANGYVDDVNGWDFANNDNNPDDPEAQGHGTSVAGCVGAVGNNGLGVVGVMWTVQLMALKIFPDDGGGAPSFASTAAAEYTALMRRDFGINIVASNNSYGALRPDDSGFPDSAAEQAIGEFTDAGGLFVAAAGNDTNDNDGTIRAYPASYDNPLIIVAAATQNTDALAGFSNFGATTVDVGAPGERVLTTERGGGYRFIDGTSFASPYTAGAVGLLGAVNPFATNSQLRDALYAGVDVVTGLQGRVATNGRVNVARSVGLVGTPGPNVLNVFPGNPSAPVDTIRVQFTETINPAFFTTGAIELRRARGDRDFNANDEIYTFPPTIATLEGQVLTIRFSAGVLPIDLYRLTLAASGFRDFEGNLLNGDLDSGNDFTYQFELTPATGAFEPNDSTSQATPVVIGADRTAFFESAFVGDGLNPTLDVDIFKVTVNAPSLITVEVIARNLLSPSTLDSVLRLFDPTGAELARNDNFRGLDSRIQYFVPNGGTYYIGVSGFGNEDYTATQVASGRTGQSEGGYNLAFRVDTAANETVVYDAGISSPGMPIPTIGTITDTIFIPDSRSIVDLNVRLNIAHSFVGDLRVTLTGPAGQSATLIANRGGSGDNITNVIFDDAATTPISAGTPPYTNPGTFRPETELSVFNRTSAVGTWTLSVADTAPLNSGALLGWSLTILVENQFSGAFELNDTRSVATDPGFTGIGSRTFNAFIGDGAFGQRDVDAFKLTLDAGTTLNASVVVPTSSGGQPNLLDTVLRLFDSQGRELRLVNRADSQNASLSYPVQYAGVYYVGVSGAGNTLYSLDQGGSGGITPATGDYSLTLSVSGGISAGEVTLAGTRMTAGFASDGSLGLTSPSQVQPLGVTLDGVDFIYSSQQDAESFFGAIFGGYVFKNAGPGRQSDLPVVMSNESDAVNRRVTTEGLFRAVVEQDDQSGGLFVRRSVSFGVNDTFMVFDVTVTNTTFFSLDGVGWVEGFNPNQSLNLGSGFPRTVNNVDNATGRLATASFVDAEGRFPGGLTFALAAAAPGAGEATPVLSVEEPGRVRDAFQVVGSVNDPDTTPLDAGVLGEGTLAIAYNIGALAPGASATMRYFVMLGASTTDVQNTFSQLNAGTGTGHLVAEPNDSGITYDQMPYAVYYPEGFASDRTQTFVPVVNPHEEPTRVVIVAHYEGAQGEQVLMDRVVAGKARDGVTISTPTLFAANQQLVQKYTPYALEVRSSRPVGATLSHYDFGISTGEAFTSNTSNVWAFAEGFKGAGVADFLVFYNPNAESIKVTLTVYPEGTGSPQTFVQSVDAERRGGWSLGEIASLPNGPFGMRISADKPIVAALTHFDTNTRGGFGVVGLPSAGVTSGSTPEGQIGVNAEKEFITVLNTNSQPANVTFSFFFTDGSTYRRLVQIPAQRRGGFSVSELPNFPRSGDAYSVGFSSDQPVVVNTSSFAFGEAVGSAFTGVGGNKWIFSEGFRPASGEGVDDLLRVFNPSSEAITVEVTMNYAANPAFDDPGASEVFRVTVNPRAANVIDVHRFVTGARATRDTYFSFEVRSPIPVVAYADHADAFLGGAFGTLGTVLGEPGAAV
jgi:subtilisin family serine protease/subtilisin-like proprotein convertase family protein